MAPHSQPATILTTGNSINALKLLLTAILLLVAVDGIFHPTENGDNWIDVTNGASLLAFVRGQAPMKRLCGNLY